MEDTGRALLDEFCRAGELQTHFYRRCQRELRDHALPTLAFVEAMGGVAAINTALIEYDALKRETAELKKQLAKATGKRDAAHA
jgi:hypothetical protein